MPKTDTSFSTYTSMMRVTSKGRPYTKDLYDMFAAVLLQIKLIDHRVMFRTYSYTFTTEEASKVMSSLVFIHVSRNPDPSDPSRQISTRTTTTFSMNYQSVKTLLQQFLSARLIMCATDPQNWNSMKDRSLWCPTLKGKLVLEEFAYTAQILLSDTLLAALHASSMSTNYDTMKNNNYSFNNGPSNRIIHLDRLSDDDDQLTFSRSNMTVIFKAMMASLPKEALLADDVPGIEKRKLPLYKYTFMGIHCINWLCDRLTIFCREEAEAVAAEFVLFGWVSHVLDKCEKTATTNSVDDIVTFKTNRNAIYYVTERGCLVTGWKMPSMDAKDEQENTMTQSSMSSKSSSTNISSISNLSNSTNNKSKNIPQQDTKLSSSNGKLMSAEASHNDVLIKDNKQHLLNRYSYYDIIDDKRIEKPIEAETIHDETAEKALEPLPIISRKSTAYEDGIPQLSSFEQPQTQGSNELRPLSRVITNSSLSCTTSFNKVNTNNMNSQRARLQKVLETPLLRMYFRDFLKANYCIENINFWVANNKLLQSLKQQQQQQQQQSNKKSTTVILELLSECYSVYEIYLGPQAVADINIDHSLRQEIIHFFSTVFVIHNDNNNLSVAANDSKNYFLVPSFNHYQSMTNTVNKPSMTSAKSGQAGLLLLPPQMVNNSKRRKVVIRSNTIVPERCLMKILKMFTKVNEHVCCMMAEDSIPKFIKTEKYKQLINAHHQQEQQGQEDNDVDYDIVYEDSSEDEKERSNKAKNNFVTSLLTQRSSMDQSQHESVTAPTTLGPLF
ncbi:uncharacterized protein BX663DRAFT_491372 [Cokeromyces recurvatus]|uniref:uncharacterized protein n=1 Tax=Cokeromyces recurvatus TaxID=90255 RepID=UPI00221F5A42|nr:uncharacterized protein BX663DRAFT_491372 [Cokeromyces recurvatus]KAI7907583.1 hypothetical protein BX663DRAFT_491372 [Cokeromyces recurvatus]